MIYFSKDIVLTSTMWNHLYVSHVLSQEILSRKNCHIIKEDNLFTDALFQQHENARCKKNLHITIQYTKTLN